MKIKQILRTTICIGLVLGVNFAYAGIFETCDPSPTGPGYNSCGTANGSGGTAPCEYNGCTEYVTVGRTQCDNGWTICGLTSSTYTIYVYNGSCDNYCGCNLPATSTVYHAGSNPC